MSAIWETVTSAGRRTNAMLSLELKNEGSVARDHLASERTFLAWLRTSLSLVSIGIAVTQLFQIPSLVSDNTNKNTSNASLPSALRFQDGLDEIYSSDVRQLDQDRLVNVARLGKPLGGAFILLGMVVLLLGCWRYFTVQKHLVKGQFVPSRAGISLIAFFVGALVVAASAVILAGRNTK